MSTMMCVTALVIHVSNAARCSPASMYLIGATIVRVADGAIRIRDIVGCTGIIY